MFIYVKDPYKVKYSLLISKSESVRLNHCDDPKPFIEYSSDMNDIYKNIDEANAKKLQAIDPF